MDGGHWTFECATCTNRKWNMSILVVAPHDSVAYLASSLRGLATLNDQLVLLGDYTNAARNRSLAKLYSKGTRTTCYEWTNNTGNSC